MRTPRTLMIAAVVALFSGTLIALPGCGEEAAPPFNPDDPGIVKSREAREAYAKTEKKETARKASGRGTDPRG